MARDSRPLDITYLANIGSSGQDGVSVSPSKVDSFFDITYRITGDPDFDLLAISMRGTLIDPSNPGLALDAIGSAVTDKGKDKEGKKEYVGHVTLLK